MTRKRSRLHGKSRCENISVTLFKVLLLTAIAARRRSTSQTRTRTCRRCPHPIILISCLLCCCLWISSMLYLLLQAHAVMLPYPCIIRRSRELLVSTHFPLRTAYARDKLIASVAPVQTQRVLLAASHSRLDSLRKFSQRLDVLVRLRTEAGEGVRSI